MVMAAATASVAVWLVATIVWRQLILPRYWRVLLPPIGRAGRAMINLATWAATVDVDAPWQHLAARAWLMSCMGTAIATWLIAVPLASGYALAAGVA